jgi:TetR/AcrR family transcriptional regulator, cholesterol catabolism regulator
MTTPFRDQVRDFKRERILEEASTLFYERGYRGTTLDAIAEQLEVSKPFIYHHFSSKAELLVEIYKRVLRLCLDTIEAALSNPGSARERLRTFAVGYTHIVIKEQAIVAIFFREEQNLPPDEIDAINALKRDFDVKLKRLLADGVDKGDFKIADISLATLALAGMMNWTYTWYRPGWRLTPDALAQSMADLAERVAGIGPEV